MKDRLSLRGHALAVLIMTALTVLWSVTESWYYNVHWSAAGEFGAEISWGFEILWGLILWCPWVLLTPVMLAFCHRFPIARENLAWAVGLHLLACPVFGLLKTLIESSLLRYSLDYPVSMVSGGSLAFASLTYLFFPAAHSGIFHVRRLRDRELRARRLEAQLAQARLESLKMPLRPHFLFNTLHAISTLVHLDSHAADRMISRLSSLLRLSLENIDRQEVSLQQELEFLDRYLDIEKMRFGDRLAVDLDIDEESRSARVPNFLLQPIVENAVKHGVGRLPSAGHITLRTYRLDGKLHIDVCDNGPGASRDQLTGGAGIGLKNTRARLEQLYGPQGEMEFATSEEGGMMVRLSLPMRTEPIDSGGDSEEDSVEQ